jgi:hypothetical protein
MFTRPHHLSLSSARSVKAMPPPSPSWRSILILSSHPFLGLPSGLFPQVTLLKPCMHLPSPSHMCYMPSQSHSSQFDHLNNIGEEYKKAFCAHMWQIKNALEEIFSWRCRHLASSLTKELTTCSEVWKAWTLSGHHLYQGTIPEFT